MINERMLYIAGNAHKQDQALTNSESIVEELAKLESRINAISSRGKNKFQFNFLKLSVKRIKNILKRIIRKQKMFCINRWMHFGESGYKNNIIMAKIDIHNEFRLLFDSLLRIKKAHSNIQEHTDIVNIYWHSKEKFEIIEKVDHCLKKFGRDIVGLEI